MAPRCRRCWYLYRNLTSVAVLVCVVKFCGTCNSFVSSNITWPGFEAITRKRFRCGLFIRPQDGHGRVKRKSLEGMQLMPPGSEGNEENAKLIFSWVDTDRKGKVSHDQLFRGFRILTRMYGKLTDAEVRQIFKTADRDKDGYLDLPEFELWIKMTNSAMKSFQKADVNQDGKIDLNEFRKAVLESHDHIAPRDVDTLFVERDTDKNGRISFVEFLDALTDSGRIKMPVDS